MDYRGFPRSGEWAPSGPIQHSGAQFSRQPSMSSMNTSRRPPSYATYTPDDGQRTISDNGDIQDTQSLYPPSYRTAPSLYGYDEDESSSAPHSGQTTLRYAPTSAFLEHQFGSTSTLTQTNQYEDEEERPETPTLRRLRISDSSTNQNSQNDLHELHWTDDGTSDSMADVDPPEYSHPSSYYILSNKTEALVTSHHVSGHLSLLHAFWRLRRTVEDLDNQPVAPFPQEKDRRWAWLVSFAVDRFSIWCESLKSEDVQYATHEIMPPIDVLMVWHTYLLNPAWYGEDTKRIPCLRVLSRIGHLRFMPALTGELSILLDAPVTDIRKETWKNKTQGRAFDVFEDAKQTRLKVFKCPDCEANIEHPYMSRDGTGFLQQNFEAFCSNIDCHFVNKVIDKTTLGARKLAEDIVRSDDTLQSFLAGSLWAQYAINRPNGQRLNTAISKYESLQCPKAFTDEQLILSVIKRYVKNEVLQSNDLIRPVNVARAGWVIEILRKHKFTLCRLINSINNAWKKSGNDSIKMLRRIYSAYTDGNVFSVDLIGAVLRQGSFVQKMHELGWSRPGYFARADDEVILQHVVTRYHAFLDLIATSPKLLYVPTLDIDLAWHTHQLFGAKYHEDCKKYVHFHLDHDDKVNESSLERAFDMTCRAWKSRFKVPYTFCGCPAPGKQMFGGTDTYSTHNYREQENLLKPRSADDLMFQASTHASDHSAVYDNRRSVNSEAIRKVRLEKRSKRENREDGILKGLTRGKSEKLESNVPHDPAFFAPIPDWYLKSTGRADCVLYAAHTIDSQYLDVKKFPVGMLQYSDLPGPTEGSDGLVRRANLRLYSSFRHHKCVEDFRKGPELEGTGAFRM